MYLIGLQRGLGTLRKEDEHNFDYSDISTLYQAKACYIT